MQRQCIILHLIRGFLIGKLPRELIKPNALNNHCLRDTVILLSRNILRWFTGTWPCPIFNLNVPSFLLGELLTFVWVMMQGVVQATYLTVWSVLKLYLFKTRWAECPHSWFCGWAASWALALGRDTSFIALGSLRLWAAGSDMMVLLKLCLCWA